MSAAPGSGTCPRGTEKHAGGFPLKGAGARGRAPPRGGAPGAHAQAVTFPHVCLRRPGHSAARSTAAGMVSVCQPRPTAGFSLAGVCQRCDAGGEVPVGPGSGPACPPRAGRCWGHLSDHAAARGCHLGLLDASGGGPRRAGGAGLSRGRRGKREGRKEVAGPRLRARRLRWALAASGGVPAVRERCKVTRPGGRAG